MESTSESFFVIFIIFVCASLFLGIWLGMLFLISFLGSWGKLHKAYKFPKTFPYKIISIDSTWNVELQRHNDIILLPGRTWNGSYDSISISTPEDFNSLERH